MGMYASSFGFDDADGEFILIYSLESNMARNVFISFRYEDGFSYKDTLTRLFSLDRDTVDFSEDVNRSWMSEETIRKYLYKKLRRSSVTIVLLTPLAVNHKRNWRGEYDDWMYDEIKYSLDDRDNNRTNGIVAVYTPEAANMIVSSNSNNSITVKNVDNLFRKNMMNVKPEYKRNPNPGEYDRDFDSYCSLISWRDFVSNIGEYVDLAGKKRDVKDRYNIVKRL